MFVTFEGIEGTGKTTQIRLLSAYLEAKGREVVITREPGGSKLGRTLRSELLDVRNTDITGQAELFLYLADRAQHVATLIRPALEAGKCVLSDRFADSTVAYQGYGRGLDPGLLHTLNQVAVNDTWPDLTILLDIEPEVGLKRALTRNIQDNTYESEGRFEAESLAFHSRVREGYQTWAALNTDRVRMVDATPGPEQVFEGVRRAVDVFMERTQAPGPS